MLHNFIAFVLFIVLLLILLRTRQNLENEKKKL